MPKIIVSLTSYPKRMEMMPRVVASLNNQTIKPDRIVIYLSKEEFLDCKNMVDEKYYEENNVTISWVSNNYGPYKKFIYSFKEFKDDIVITVDDDVEYAETMIEDLLSGAEKFPDAVIARRARLITSTDDDRIETYENWSTIREEEAGFFANNPRFDLIAIGMGGVLYHPNRFSEEIFREDLFKEVCPNTDDLWLKLFEVLANVPVVLVDRMNNDSEIKEISRDGLYVNRNKEGGNQIAIENIFNFCKDKGITAKQICDSIFSVKRIYKSELETVIGTYIYGENYEKIHKRIKNNALNPSELIDLVKTNDNIYIYGSGTYGRHLLQLIFSVNVYKRVVFIETEVEYEKKIFGINVLKVENLIKEIDSKENVVIILAGSVNNSYSMAIELERIGFSKYYSFGEGTREFLLNNEHIRFLNSVQWIKNLKKISESCDSQLKIETDLNKEIIKEIGLLNTRMDVLEGKIDKILFNLNKKK